MRMDEFPVESGQKRVLSAGGGLERKNVEPYKWIKLMSKSGVWIKTGTFYVKGPGKKKCGIY